MKYYCEYISVPLAEKLKEKGMSITYSNHPHQIGPDIRGIVMGNFKEIDCPTFGACFDWLMSRGFACEVYGRGSGYDYVIVKECNDATRGTNLAHNNYEGPNGGACWDTWHEAAEKAIEKALTLI